MSLADVGSAHEACLQCLKENMFNPHPANLVNNGTETSLLASSQRASCVCWSPQAGPLKVTMGYAAWPHCFAPVNSKHRTTMLFLFTSLLRLACPSWHLWLWSQVMQWRCAMDRFWPWTSGCQGPKLRWQAALAQQHSLVSTTASHSDNKQHVRHSCLDSPNPGLNWLPGGKAGDKESW